MNKCAYGCEESEDGKTKTIYLIERINEEEAKITTNTTIYDEQGNKALTAYEEKRIKTK